MKPRKLPDVKILRKRFIYNPKTGVLVMKTDGNNQVKAGDIVGNIHESGYLTVGVNRQLYYVHRIIYLLATGKDPSEYQVDHIDGDRTNNRINNLRLVSNSGNQRNRLVSGVTFYKNNNKWGARITTDEGRLFLGMFVSEQEAIKARKQAEVKYWGKETNRRA